MKKLLITTDIIFTLALGLCLTFIACNKDELISDTPPIDTVIASDSIATGSSRAAGRHLEIINNALYLDGELFKIVEANSPESRLRECSFAELDQLNACGINTIYATLYGGDVTSIHPFINRSNPGAGFNDAVVNTWVAYLERWIFGYPGQRHIVHLLLSEKENHFSLSEANHKAMLTYFANKFRNFEGYIIYNREELPTGQTSYINNYYRYLKQVAPFSIRGIHNNTNENPWRGFEASSDTLIQFLAFQEWQGNFDRRIRAEVARGKWAGYASEVTGGFQTAPNCSTLTATLCNAGGIYSSGMGFFISSKDHSAPTFHSSYCSCYQYAASLLGNTVTPPPPDDTVVTPPPPGNIVVEYATTWNKSNAQTLNNNATLTQGSYWIFVRTGAAPMTFTLRKGTGTPVTKTDATAPFDYNGNNNTYLQRGYTYTLTVQDGNNQSVVINFSVN